MSNMSGIPSLAPRLSGAAQAFANNSNLRLLGTALPSDLQVGDRVSVRVIQANQISALLQMEGQAVQVQSPGVPPGTELTARVASQGAQPTLVVDGLPLRLSADSLPANLRPGDQVPATVLQSNELPLIVDLNGKSVPLTANTLPAGGEVTVQIGSLGSAAPSLSLVNSGSATLPQLPPLQIGQTVTVNVEKVLPDGSLQVLLQAASGGNSPSGNSATTSLGSPLAAASQGSAANTASVENVLPNGRLQILVQGTPSQAQGTTGTTPGSQLTLEVTQLQPQVAFRILVEQPPVESQVVPLIRAGAAETAAPGQSLSTLQTALDQVAGQPSSPPSLTRLQSLIQSLLPDKAPQTESIARWVRDGGMNFEAKLAHVVLTGESAQSLHQVAESDLKGALLQALADTHGGSAGAAQTVVDPIVSQLNHIEAQQGLNVLTQLQQGAFQLQIPVFTGQGLATAALSIEPDARGGQSGGGNSPGYNVLFLLDLDGLGPTRVDAHLTDRSVRAVFYLAPGEGLTRVQGELPAFEQTLNGLGFPEVLLAARPLDQLAADKQQKLQALSTGVPGNIRLVDARA